MRNRGFSSNCKLRSWTNQINVRNRSIAQGLNSGRDRAKRTPLRLRKKMARTMFQLKMRQNGADRRRAGDREMLIQPQRRSQPLKGTQEGTILPKTCSRSRSNRNQGRPQCHWRIHLEAQVVLTCHRWLRRHETWEVSKPGTQGSKEDCTKSPMSKRARASTMKAC